MSEPKFKVGDKICFKDTAVPHYYTIKEIHRRTDLVPPAYCYIIGDTGWKQEVLESQVGGYKPKDSPKLEPLELPPEPAERDLRVEDGIKHDTGKPPLSWVPRSLKESVAQVLEFGATKYGRDNWRKGMEWSRILDAALRHMEKWNSGEDLDHETGLSHLAHAATNLAFLIEYQQEELGTDNRAGHTKPETIKKPGSST